MAPAESDGAFNMEEVAERCREFLAHVKTPDWPFFDGKAMNTVEFVSAAPGVVRYKFTVAQGLCNALGNLHGGCAATILDFLTSTTILTIQDQGNLEFGTVSRTLSCTYLRALPDGEECTVICEVVRVGKRLIHLKGEIRGKDGLPAVVCSHDKVPVSFPKV